MFPGNALKVDIEIHPVVKSMQFQVEKINEDGRIDLKAVDVEYGEPEVKITNIQSKFVKDDP